MSGQVNSVIAVLGLALEPNGEPSPELKQRCKWAADLLQESLDSVIIVTGGDPAKVGITEAKVMKMLLVSRGVDEEKIILEEQAFDTASNAYYTLSIGSRISSESTLRIKLVTSGFHMQRSAWLFRQIANAMGLRISLEQQEVPWAGDASVLMGCLEQEKVLLRTSPMLLERRLARWGLYLRQTEDLSEALQLINEQIENVKQQRL